MFSIQILCILFLKQQKLFEKPKHFILLVIAPIQHIAKYGQYDTHIQL